MSSAMSFTASAPCASRSAALAFSRSRSRMRRKHSSHAKERFIPNRSASMAFGAPAPCRAASSTASRTEGIGRSVTSRVSVVAGAPRRRADEGSAPTCAPATADAKSRLCLNEAHICDCVAVDGYGVVPPSRHVAIRVHSYLPPPAS
jgi:hypothetical protein